MKKEDVPGDDRIILKEKSVRFFERNCWQQCIEALEKSLGNSKPDQEALTRLGLCNLRLGRYDQALISFEKLQSPIPALAALSWAFILTRQREYDAALEVLSRVDRSFRTKPTDEALDVVACILLDDILSVIGRTRNIESLKLAKRCRLLKLASLGILPFSRILGIFGRVLGRFKFQGGATIEELAKIFSQLCWVQGLPIRLDFVEEPVDLNTMKGYDASKDVYRDIFLLYLDYWLNSEVDITNFLIGSVKPGDAHALYCLVHEKQPSVVLEVGTFLGFSTSIMAQALKENGKGIIHCVDPNVKFFSTKAPLVHARKMLKTQGLDDRVRIHEGFFSDSRETYESRSPVLGRTISEIVPSVDLAFIDGDHATTAVLQDFMLLLPVLKHNATVIFHDIKSWPSVKQGILTIFQDDVWRKQMRYYELSPSGYDGLGIVEIHKRSQNTKGQ